MNTLFLECNMGAAGDMLMAALYELCSPEQQQSFLHTMAHAGLGEVHLVPQPAMQCGIQGTHMEVKIHGEEEHLHAHTHDAPPHTHTALAHLTHRIEHLCLPDAVKQNAIAAYTLLAQAESEAHGVSITDIHFHEVGTLDAIADITGVCLLIDLLQPQQILASPVATGSGTVRCAHGILPVPAPATAWLLRGIPAHSGTEQAELCTPTGAALLRHFVSGFGPMPVLRTQAIGYGMGTKAFATANCVRAFWGQSAGAQPPVTELHCNLDDMTPEAMAFAQQQLLEAGALDVYTTAIGMKKSRAGTKLSVLCPTAEVQRFAELLLRHTTTLGVRAQSCERFTLEKNIENVNTVYGTFRIKTAQGYGLHKAKPEYEDIAAAARKHGVPFAVVEQAAMTAYYRR